jgi:malonate-semialdehyde dehydrogenase (acetylating)/methylmalonate-semialdehyde dehydrogenase
MAISVPILVGDAQKWIPEIVERAKKLTVGAGINNADIAPINTVEAKQRVESLIEAGSKEAKLLLDGRGYKV